MAFTPLFKMKNRREVYGLSKSLHRLLSSCNWVNPIAYICPGAEGKHKDPFRTADQSPLSSVYTHTYILSVYFIIGYCKLSATATRWIISRDGRPALPHILYFLFLKCISLSCINVYTYSSELGKQRRLIALLKGL